MCHNRFTVVDILGSFILMWRASVSQNSVLLVLSPLSLWFPAGAFGPIQKIKKYGRRLSLRKNIQICDFLLKIFASLFGNITKCLSFNVCKILFRTLDLILLLQKLFLCYCSIIASQFMHGEKHFFKKLTIGLIRFFHWERIRGRTRMCVCRLKRLLFASHRSDRNFLTCPLCFLKPCFP